MPSTPAEYQKMFEVEERMWWYRVLHEKVLRHIEKAFPNQKNMSILDACCGTGGLLHFLRKNAYSNAQGIDYSTDAIHFCSSRGLQVSKQNILQISVNQSFDVIICNDALCYFNDSEIEQIFHSFQKLLKPGGIIISNNNAFNLFWGTHDIAVASKRRFVWSDFVPFIQENNFQIQYFSYWSLVLSPLILAIRLSQRLSHWLSPKASYKSDVDCPSPFVNNMLYQLVKWEEAMLPYQGFGSSLFWVLKAR